MRNDRWTWRYAAICPHPGHPHVLLVRAASGGLTLPWWRGAQPAAWQDVTAVQRTMRERFGVEAVALRCVRQHRDPAAQRTDLWYELDSLTLPGSLPEGRWYGWEALAEVTDATQRTLLERWFMEAQEGVPLLRRPWARPGWFVRARAWIVEQCRHLGVRVSGPVAQIRTWRRCCLLTIPTSEGLLYFKALPSASAHEVALLGLLARHFPARVVQVLATHADHHWLLMADLCGDPLDSVVEITQWERSVRDYAALQVTMTRYYEALLSLGCPDQRPQSLSDQIDPFLANWPGDTILSSADRDRLNAMAPHLKARCTELTTAAVPATVEHGDLWPSNVALTSRGPAYFDWSESSVAHPFFSMYFFLRPEAWPEPLRRRADVRTRLQAAYLEPWTVFATRAYLADLFTHAQALAPLHHALLAQRRFLADMEETWEKEVAVSFVAMLLHDLP